jgi:hypothetical protein
VDARGGATHALSLLCHRRSRPAVRSVQVLHVPDRFQFDRELFRISDPEYRLFRSQLTTRVGARMRGTHAPVEFAPYSIVKTRPSRGAPNAPTGSHRCRVRSPGRGGRPSRTGCNQLRDRVRDCVNEPSEASREGALSAVRGYHEGTCTNAAAPGWRPESASQDAARYRRWFVGNDGRAAMLVGTATSSPPEPTRGLWRGPGWVLNYRSAQVPMKRRVNRA